MRKHILLSGCWALAFCWALFSFPVQAEVRIQDLDAIDSSLVQVGPEPLERTSRPEIRQIRVRLRHASGVPFPKDSILLAFKIKVPEGIVVGNAQAVSTEGIPYFKVDASDFGPGRSVWVGIELINEIQRHLLDERQRPPGWWHRYRKAATLWRYLEYEATAYYPNHGSVPIADAGADRNVLTNTEVRLDGSASYDPGGGMLTFDWTTAGIPKGSTVALNDPGRPGPTFVPDMDGDYAFDLIVDNGQATSMADQITISATHIDTPPNADAGRDREVPDGAPVALDGTGSNDPQDLPLTYAWSFTELPESSVLRNADITDGNNVEAEFRPDAVGIFTLDLVVHNGNQSDTDSVSISVLGTNVAPVAAVGGDRAVKPGEEATLDGNLSRDPDSGPVPITYQWSLVTRPSTSKVTNAAIADGDRPVARFTPDMEGNYIARIEVNDGQYRNGSNMSVFADATSPTLSITSPAAGSTVEATRPGISVRFSDEGAGIASDSFQLLLNGIDVTGGVAVGKKGASYTPPADLPGGDNAITARIADRAGNLGEVTNTFSISVFRAIADCGPTRGTAPHRVTYRSRGQFTGGSIVQYQWDLDGDGSYDTPEDPVPRDYTHTFDSPGTYNAVLEVQNNFGKTATDTCTITVEQEPPTVTATASPSNGPVPLAVTLICQGQSPNGAIVRWEWDFDGDGTYDYSSDTSGTTTHTYGTVGEFTARCRGTDTAGLSGVSGEINTKVRPRPPGSPSVTATASPTSGTAPLAVGFDGSVTGGGTIVRYEWDFDGDGTYDHSSTTSAAVSHTYEAAGIFAATLRVTNDTGLTSLDSIAIQVNVTASLSIPDDTFRPEAGESATVTTTLTGTVPVRVRIRGKVGLEVRTLVDETRAAGTYNDHWDGRDDAGDLLPDGDYYAVLEYDVGGETKRIDLTDSTGGDRYNPERNNLPSHFDPYENDPLPITFTVPSNQGASGILAFVGLFNTNTRLITLLDRKPFGVGDHTIYWDGLLPDGSFAVPPPGDSFLFGLWGYTLPDNAIYLASAPTIANFSVQPTLNSPTRDGSRPFRITFDLDRDADLELLVVNLASGGVVFTKRFPGITAGTGRTLAWDGLTSRGFLPDKGDYRLALTAVDGSGGASLTRYMLLRVFY
ncbi:MAG: PKD domain-containing protein [Candidatus Thiosymbion ectosymbiont of Robbea hypermnestra]|nr:PKD domain-containing protein [Candidatus Thiosymbion ectosymbiont of Robbea hypermnestra]